MELGTILLGMALVGIMVLIFAVITIALIVNHRRKQKKKATFLGVLIKYDPQVEEGVYFMDKELYDVFKNEEPKLPKDQDPEVAAVVAKLKKKYEKKARQRQKHEDPVDMHYLNLSRKWEKERA